MRQLMMFWCVGTLGSFTHCLYFDFPCGLYLQFVICKALLATKVLNN